MGQGDYGSTFPRMIRGAFGSSRLKVKNVGHVLLNAPRTFGAVWAAIVKDWLIAP